MTDSAKIAAKLPSGEADGLSHIAPQLIRDPHAFRVILAIIDCKTTTVDNDEGSVVPTARIRRVEVVLDADLPAAEQLMRRALENRSGRTVLPLDLEDDVAIAFRHVDPATGEKLGGDDDGSGR
jgi:hypothetical protein